ncbi:MAG: tRNA lysidine(34) synthetase TilS, partial [Burkholderiales bacterium]|nr:tRNA lysidine(34) synthetase TilS [Burkholderiales bacterium]
MKDDLVARVRAGVQAHVPRNVSLVIGLSGGIDSMVLLHVLVRGLRMSPRRISAIHVNHQLSPQAARWASFCRRCCRDFGIRLHVAKVAVRRGNSTEAAARAARYGVFAASGAGVVVLAHNRDDQAETVLLQLLRGAGPRGLAGMPVFRTGGASAPAVLRPLLEVPRSLIAAYARRHRLQWVEDDSNGDRAYLRNFLRHEVLPLIEGRLPGAGVTLSRAARLQAEASDLLDALALADLGGNAPRDRLPLAPIKALPPHRAKNALRYFLRGNGLLMPDADRLDELLRQVITARGDAAVRIGLDGVELRRFHDALYMVRPLPALARDFVVSWDGRGALHL